jgi:hypothetical protein
MARLLAPGAEWTFTARDGAHVNAPGHEGEAWLTVEPSGHVVAIMVGGARWRRDTFTPCAIIRERGAKWLRARASSRLRRAEAARALLSALGWAP